MHENMVFVIGKLNFISYQFVLGAFPLRPKKPFGQRNIDTYKHKIHKGPIGSCGGTGLYKLKIPSNINHLAKSTVFIIYQASTVQISIINGFMLGRTINYLEL